VPLQSVVGEDGDRLRLLFSLGSRSGSPGEKPLDRPGNLHLGEFDLRQRQLRQNLTNRSQCPHHQRAENQQAGHDPAAGLSERGPVFGCCLSATGLRRADTGHSLTLPCAGNDHTQSGLQGDAEPAWSRRIVMADPKRVPGPQWRCGRSLSGAELGTKWGGSVAAGGKGGQSGIERPSKHVNCSHSECYVAKPPTENTSTAGSSRGVELSEVRW